MKYAKLASLLLSIISLGAGSALAGDTAYSEHASTARFREKRPHGAVVPFIYIGRVVESFLHAPRLLQEGIEGDRALVNQHGFLGVREVPVEENIVSPADGVFTVK